METKLKLNDPEKAQKYFGYKMEFTTGPMELQHLRDQDILVNIIDLRAPEDFIRGHIPGALNLPQDKWETLEGLKNDMVNVLYCYSQVCHLAPKAAFQFAAKGFSVMELEGGFQAWKDYELEIEVSKESEKKVTPLRSTMEQAPTTH